jgi:hypothetical protein
MSWASGAALEEPPPHGVVSFSIYYCISVSTAWLSFGLSAYRTSQSGRTRDFDSRGNCQPVDGIAICPDRLNLPEYADGAIAEFTRRRLSDTGLVSVTAVRVFTRRFGIRRITRITARHAGGLKSTRSSAR